MGQREQWQQQGAKAKTGNKSDRRTGSEDIKSAEKCWRYADTKRGTEAEEAKAILGSKAGSENGWIETTFGIEVMKIYC